jgi:pimeloyl-ACP methyl ester carboxylesterase
MQPYVLTTPTGITELRERDGVDSPILFVPGHTSGFNGNKAKQLATICEKLNRPVILPAYYGYEGSRCAGVPEGGKGYIRHWLSQFLDILDHHCPQPVVLVGHSMGGIIMLQLARRRPEKIAGLIGIAAGFGVNGQAKATEIYGNSDFVGLQGHTPLRFTPEGAAMLFAPDSFAVTVPVRLQYGLCDDVISWHNGTHIANACTSDDVEIWLNKNGTHAMDDAASLNWLEQEIQRVTAKT